MVVTSMENIIKNALNFFIIITQRTTGSRKGGWRKKRIIITIRIRITAITIYNLTQDPLADTFTGTGSVAVTVTDTDTFTVELRVELSWRCRCR